MEALVGLVGSSSARVRPVADMIWQQAWTGGAAWGLSRNSSPAQVVVDLRGLFAVVEQAAACVDDRRLRELVREVGSGEAAG